MKNENVGSIGMQDLPIMGEVGEDGKFIGDSLGVGKYADALALFISQCDTPITIAISGPWGSGKTSVMNMVKTKLDDKIIPVWFNCWQFSQFNLSSDLAAVMMNFITEELQKGVIARNLKEELSGKATSFIKKTKSLFGTTLKVAASTAGIKGDELVDALIETKDSIQSAKESMEEMIRRRIESDKKDRVVIFIDDLDRVVPTVALELLEVMKLFLDVKGCVFVMACDFDVVKRGVAAKFKSDKSEISGRSFFDKLIQLSFNMPVSAYNTRKYVHELLEKIEFQIGDDDLDDYIDLLMFSIGFNPRAFKILANSLVLMNKLVGNQLAAELNGSKPENFEKIVFALTCMERAYPELYHLFITRLKNKDRPLNFLTKDLASTKVILELEALRPIFSENSDKEIVANKIKDFARTFVNVLDTDNDRTLSNQEIENIKQIVKLSALTARGSQKFEEEEVDTRNDDVTNFCRKVHEIELFGIMESSLYPQGHSRKSNFNGRDNSRWYDVWFKPGKTKKAWGNNKVVYEIKLIPKNGNSLILMFWVNKSTGIDGNKIMGLSELQIVQSGKYAFEQDNGAAWIQKDFGYLDITNQDGDLNVESAKQVAQWMKELITATHNYFD